MSSLTPNLLAAQRRVRVGLVGPLAAGFGHDAARFDDIESALAGLETIDALLIAERDPDTLAVVVAIVRADPRAAAMPLFIPAGVPFADAGDEILIDGAVRSVEEAAALARPIADALAALPAGAATFDADMRLLRFLYARPLARIRPARTWNDPFGYRYPLLEVIADRLADVRPWLRSLASRKLLAPAELLDRLRHCPSCSFVHLNYVDVCPHDDSLDILETTFLHCFACGNVAPEQAFTAAARLQCPKCTAILRQIGVDYDRALESYHCRTDGADFAEPKIVAECLNCRRRTPPEELVVAPVHSWLLAEAGKAAARTERIGDLYALLDQLNFAAPQFFFATLAWLVQLRRRYPDTAFAVAGARFDGIAKIAERFGQVRATIVLDEFAQRLRELIRVTDVAARIAEREIWVILPQTGLEGAEILGRKLRALADPDGAGITVTTVVAGAEAFAHGEDVDTTIARLTNTFA